MIEKKAVVDHEIIDTLVQRWSPRSFNEDRPVTQQDVLKLCEAARWSPSSYSEQPWRLLVCNKHRNLLYWTKLYETLAPANQTWANRAPILAAVIACSIFQRDKLRNRHAEYDTGAAMMALCVQATALHLACHQMAGFDAQRVKTAFSIPTEYIVLSIMAIGYASPAEQLPEEHLITQERGPRTRKPITDCFFENSWGKTITL